MRRRSALLGFQAGPQASRVCNFARGIVDGSMRLSLRTNPPPYSPPQAGGKRNHAAYLHLSLRDLCNNHCLHFPCTLQPSPRSRGKSENHPLPGTRPSRSHLPGHLNRLRPGRPQYEMRPGRSRSRRRRFAGLRVLTGFQGQV